MSDVLKRRDLAALAALIAFGLLALYPALGAQFVLVDDHEILRLTMPASGPPLSNLGTIVLSADPAAGRFRPMYWVARLTEVALFADAAPAWHAFVLGLGLTSAALLYATARSLGLRPLLAGLLGAWLVVPPGASSNWVRLGTNETIAMPFFVLALLAAARCWDAAFVVAALGAMLSKESFALAAPALAGVRIIAGSGRRGRLSAGVVLAAGVALTAASIVIAARAGGQSYGGAFLSAPGATQYAVDILHNLAIVAFATSGWLVLLVWWARPLPRMHWPWTALVLLLVVPQVLLYSRQGVFEGKYEFPAVIGVAGWLVGMLAWLGRRSQERLYVFGVTAWSAALVAYAFSTWTYATSFAADSIQLQRMVTYAATNVPHSDIVGIAGDPASEYEPMLSFVDQFAHAGREDLQLRALPVPPERPYGPHEADLARALLATSLGQSNPLAAGSCANVGAVIVLRDEAAAEQAAPCLREFERVEFSDTALLWGGDQVSLRPRLPGHARAGYTLLVRRA